MDETFDFGKALELLKAGHKVARKGWNGKGIYLELQKPDVHSSDRRIYIVITKLVTDNPAAPIVVPWLASQTESFCTTSMLAEDWVKVD